MTFPTTNTYKCAGCGYQHANPHMVGAHAGRCRQFQEWKQLVIKDPKTGELIKELGLAGAADKLGINSNTIGNWFTGNGERREGIKNDTSPDKNLAKSDSLVVELTEEQVIRVLRQMIQEHDQLAACKEEAAALRDQVARLRTEVERQTATIKRMNEAKLQPFRVKIEREAIEQSRDARGL